LCVFVFLPTFLFEDAYHDNRLARRLVSASSLLPLSHGRVCVFKFVVEGLIPNTPADLVQDIYLREIKAYKPTPTVSCVL
jgi:hypothetical protein